MPTGVYIRARPRRKDESTCAHCSRFFVAMRSESQGTAKFCSRRCLVRWLHRYRRILKEPDDELRETLRRLYWDERRTAVEIAKMYGTSHNVIFHTMKALGVPSRSKGKKPEPLACRVPGCVQPPQRIWHKKYRCFYGRLCAGHRHEHRLNLGRVYKSSRYPKLSEEERWLRKAKETLVKVKKLSRSPSL